jgi:hypothetical protein
MSARKSAENQEFGDPKVNRDNRPFFARVVSGVCILALAGPCLVLCLALMAVLVPLSVGSDLVARTFWGRR